MGNQGLAIGLMSGTSGDGIDAALVRFTERDDSPFPHMELVGAHYVPYTAEQRKQVFQLFSPDVKGRYVAKMHVIMGEWFGHAARELMDKQGLHPDDVTVVGCHGQTVYHAPQDGVTLQIGDATRISLATGCPVVSDFRRQDLAQGGQGAPLVPYFDYAYFHGEDVTRVLLNVGGISNITVLPPGGALQNVRAFDTGPGNMVIDGAVTKLTNGQYSFDRDGEMASQGTPSTDIVDKWLAEDEYIQAAPPKSTGRERYGEEAVAKYLQDVAHLPVDSQISTLTYFVAQTIASAVETAVDGDFELIVGGGGRHNRALVRWIQERCQPSRIVASDVFGIPSDMKEAMAFALFAWQFVQNRPTNIMTATGARALTLLGQWTPRPLLGGNGGA